MAADLKDFRGRITAETDCALEAIARTTGQDRQEILRDVMHAWAMKQIDAAMVIDQLLRGEGLGGIGEGISGSYREDGGVTGSARESAGALNKRGAP